MLGDIEGFKVRRFSVEEFTAQSRFQNVERVIHVGVSSNSDPVMETAWLQGLADVNGMPHGIVARCDLAATDAAETLDRHLAYANMRGLRDNGSPGSFDSPAWRRGYSRMASDDLVFCHQIGVERVDEAVLLLRDIPDVVFCVDHAAMPGERTPDYFTHWRDSVRRLAEYPQAVCKISALGMGEPRWTPASIKPWVLELIDAFGAERCFFGSNFPVDGIFSTYSDLINAFRDIVSAFSPSEQAGLLHLNANRIFRV
jgi:predicted TIM-barrel fold metal-dependent hydrolase